MGLMANRLRRERTTASGKRPTTTMNAPGTFIPRYGKVKVTIGGRGASGNNAQPGNISYYNPDSGGNVYYNTTYMYGSSYTVFTSNVDGSTDTSYGDRPWGPSTRQPSRTTYTANPGYPGNSVVNFNVEGYGGGNRSYNPYYPGNAVYNASTPGTAGTPTTVLGVAFPGGNVGALAPIVPDTPILMPYAGPSTGITIAVPPGGSVVIKEK